MVESEAYISSFVEDFLSFLGDIQTTYNMATATLDEANLELCDLEHYLELETCNAATTAKIAKRIREVRKKRRQAKNSIEICEQMLSWIDLNKKPIDDLSNVLGKIRKMEDRQEARVYAVRSHILDDITTKTHLATNGIG